jgi:hypothetical protein
MVKRPAFFIVFLFLWMLLPSAHGGSTKSLPPYPSVKGGKPAALWDLNKAKELYRCAAKENRRLRWNECLSQKARARAKKMVQKDYFDHLDPQTGENPSWDLVIECFTCRFAGENLSRGYESAAAIHQAWMESRTHRKNIEDPRFQLIGIGCYDYICVELFAGL